MIYLNRYEQYEYWLYNDTVYSCSLDYYSDGSITWYYGSGWEVEADEQPTLVFNLTNAREEALARMPKRVEFKTKVINPNPYSIIPMYKVSCDFPQTLFDLGTNVKVIIEEVQE